MSEVVTVESNERLVETDQVLDTLVVVELEQMRQVDIELQEMLATEIELIETQRNLPEVIDVAGERVVLEVGLQGPAGPPGDAPPISPTLTWAAGKLASIVYADGSSKTFSYTGDRLTQIDFLRTGYPGARKSLSYNPDGTLAAVAQSAI